MHGQNFFFVLRIHLQYSNHSENLFYGDFNALFPFLC